MCSARSGDSRPGLTSPSERFLPASAGFVPNLSSLEDAENGTPGPQAGPDRDPQAFSGTVLKTPAGTLRVGSKNRAMTTTSPYPTGSSSPGNSTHPITAGQATTTFTIVPQHEAQLYLAFKNNRQGIEEYLTNKTEIEAFLKNKSAFEAYMEKKEENDILMQTLQRSQHDLPGDEMLTESGTTPAVSAPPIPIQPKFPWTHWSAGRPLVSPERRDLLLSFLRSFSPAAALSVDGNLEEMDTRPASQASPAVAATDQLPTSLIAPAKRTAEEEPFLVNLPQLPIT
ncbi:hypothetical protein HPB47_023350 [Ixodes persulcatus]|uniref:Uncharacterized protein n=1 Tax=Ixodes persulcatus TaxID=34615 RepID=A0AC60Q8E7_IXOPE|nr:hypothetical protein HPB47_023350 [Ixodes persulcatus]